MINKYNNNLCIIVIMKNYTTILREYNLKATPQRLAIIESVDIYGHINIDSLYEEVKTFLRAPLMFLTELCNIV